MFRKVAVLLLVMLALGAVSVAFGQPDSIRLDTSETTISPSTAVPARAAAGGVVAVVVEIFSKLAFVLPFLLMFGASWKYLPKVRGLVNEGVIPILNAALAFLIAFGGGASTAHAGIFGDIGRALGFPAQAMASVLMSLLSSYIHDKFLKGVTPPSPYKADMTKAEKAGAV